MSDTEVPHGSQVLDEARAFMTRFVRYPSDAAADAAVLWMAAAHACDSDNHPVWEKFGRIAFVSNDPGSGKSEALNMVCRLAPRGEVVGDISPLGLAAAINEDQATVGIDEFDMKMSAKSQGNMQLRAILNDGYSRNATIRRADRRIPTYGPVAIAGLAKVLLGNPHLEPLRTRSIIIIMLRLNDAQAALIERFRDREHAAHAEAIRRSVSRWILADVKQLATSWPDLPAGFHSRLADVWEPLFAVADYAGGEWPQRARDAAVALVYGDTDGEVDQTPGERVLTDVAAVRMGDDRITTADLIGRLKALPDAPWASLWPNDITAPRELAVLLRERGLKPVKVWADGRALQGYDLASWPETFQQKCAVIAARLADEAAKELSFT